MNLQALRRYTLSPRLPCVSIIGPSGSKYAGRDNAIDKFEINTIEALPVMFNYLVAETAEDIELQELFQGLQNGTELKMMTRFYIRKIRQGNLIVERQSCNATIVWQCHEHCKAMFYVNYTAIIRTL